MAGETRSSIDLTRLSNAHLVHAMMPTVLSMLNTWENRDGIKVSGVEINGKEASFTIDGKIVVALAKELLTEIDAACVSCLAEAPSVVPTPTPQTGEAQR